MNIKSDLYLLRYAISEMEYSVLLNWVILLAITIALWVAVKSQNKRYKQLIGEGEYYSEERHELFRLAQMRGSVMLLFWLTVALLLIIGDVKTQINRSRNYLSASDEAFINKEAKNPFVSERVVAEQFIDAASDATEREEMQGEAGFENSSPAPSLEHIKSSYEDAFVSLLILRKCNLVGEIDERALYNSLIKALSSDERTVEAQKALIAKGVMSAASGSYHSLYNNIKCDGANIKNTQTNFALFMKQVGE